MLIGLSYGKCSIGLLKKADDPIDARQDLATAIVGSELEWGHNDLIAMHHAQRPPSADQRVHRLA